MPLPKITGLLQNCALNSALPTLLNGIEALAMHEAHGTLNLVNDNIIVQNYLRLKTIFADHYGIVPHEDLTWSEFHTFLNRHSFYAKEIIFAPIFRIFIGEEGLQSGAYPSVDLLTRVQQRGGQYLPLATREVATLFHNCFGISLKSYEYMSNERTGNPMDNYAARDVCNTSLVDYPFGETPTLNLYLKQSHFEIQPHELLAESERKYAVEIRNLPQSLSTVHNGLSFSQTALESNRYLYLLCNYVHNNLVTQLQTIEQLKPRLTMHRNRFNELLGELDQINSRLREQARIDPAHYNRVLGKGERLRSQLQIKSGEFFACPTPRNFHLFKDECHRLISDAGDEFKKHRGNPLVNAVWAVIKGILGILAAVTVIPAYIIEKQSRYGFVKTFFSIETKSAQQLAEVEENLHVLEQQIGVLIPSRA